MTIPGSAEDKLRKSYTETGEGEVAFRTVSAESIAQLLRVQEAILQTQVNQNELISVMGKILNALDKVETQLSFITNEKL